MGMGVGVDRKVRRGGKDKRAVTKEKRRKEKQAAR